MEKAPIRQEMSSENNNVETQVKTEKEKLFGLTEEELAELDKKDPEKYWNN